MKQSFKYALIIIFSVLTMLVSNFASSTASTMLSYNLPVKEANISSSSFSQYRRMELRLASKPLECSSSHSCDKDISSSEMMTCVDCIATCSSSFFLSSIAEVYYASLLHPAWRQPLKIGDVLSFIQTLLRPPKA